VIFSATLDPSSVRGCFLVAAKERERKEDGTLKASSEATTCGSTGLREPDPPTGKETKMKKYYVTYKTYGGPSCLTRTVAPTVHRIASRHTSLDAAKKAIRRNYAAGILEVESARRPEIGEQVWP